MKLTVREKKRFRQPIFFNSFKTQFYKIKHQKICTFNLFETRIIRKNLNSAINYKKITQETETDSLTAREIISDLAFNSFSNEMTQDSGNRRFCLAWVSLNIADLDPKNIISFFKNIYSNIPRFW